MILVLGNGGKLRASLACACQRPLVVARGTEIGAGEALNAVTVPNFGGYAAPRNLARRRTSSFDAFWPVQGMLDEPPSWKAPAKCILCCPSAFVLSPTYIVREASTSGHSPATYPTLASTHRLYLHPSHLTTSDYHGDRCQPQPHQLPLHRRRPPGCPFTTWRTQQRPLLVPARLRRGQQHRVLPAATTPKALRAV